MGQRQSRNLSTISLELDCEIPVDSGVGYGWWSEPGIVVGSEGGGCGPGTFSLSLAKRKLAVDRYTEGGVGER